MSIYKNYGLDMLRIGTILYLNSYIDMHYTPIIIDSSLRCLLMSLCIQTLISYQTKEYSNIFEFMLILDLGSLLKNHTGNLMYSIIFTAIHMLCATHCASFMINKIGRMSKNKVHVSPATYILASIIFIYCLTGMTFYDNMDPFLKFVVRILIHSVMYFQMLCNTVYALQKTKDEPIYCNYLLVSSTINNLIMFLVY